MRNTQKIITKMKHDDHLNDVHINEKIEQLKRKFRKYSSGRIGEMYNILAKIVKLKRALPENQGRGKNYTMRSLEWEEGINLHGMQIRYIQSYQFISDYGLEKVELGFVSDTTICHFLAISTLLREEKWQNKLIDLVIARKIRPGEVSELKRDELKLLLQGKLRKRTDDKYILASTKTLRAMLARLKDREEILKNSVYRDNLLRSINKMKKYLEELKYDN